MIYDNVLLHIGYQKTGTTWLQRCFFNQPHTGFCLPVHRTEITELIVTPHPLDFDPENCAIQLQHKLDQSNSCGEYPVLSFERLSGSPYRGGYDSKEIADRIAAVFAQPKIFIVVREQVEMLCATYNQYVKTGGTLSLLNYLQRGKTQTHIRDFELVRFQYHRLIKYYIELFGSSNVLVLPYELFRQDPQTYIREISKFCNIDMPQTKLDSLAFDKPVNASIPQSVIHLLAKTNKFIGDGRQMSSSPLIKVETKTYSHYVRSKARAVGRRMPKSYENTAQAWTKNTIREAVDGYYNDSNRLLSQITGLNLKAYGYMS